MAAKRRRWARRLPWWLWLSTASVVVAFVVGHTRVGVAVAALLVGLVVLLTVRRAVTSRRVRSWADAERATADWLRRRGCRGVRLSSPGADGGVDVVTRGLAVQVKHTAGRVGRPTIQQIVGAALTLDLSPAVFSTSGFSAPAIVYADDHDVAIFLLHINGRADALNKAARRVGRRRLTRSG